jgi:hypothetical protein
MHGICEQVVVMVDMAIDFKVHAVASTGQDIKTKDKQSSMFMLLLPLRRPKNACWIYRY